MGVVFLGWPKETHPFGRPYREQTFAQLLRNTAPMVANQSNLFPFVNDCWLHQSNDMELMDSLVGLSSLGNMFQPNMLYYLCPFVF